MTIAGNDFLLGGDIITALNEKKFDSPEHIIAALAGLHVGDEVNLQVFRDGKQVTVKYKLSERPLLPGDMPGQAVMEPVSQRRTSLQSAFRF